MGAVAEMDKFFDLNDKTWHLDQTHDDDVANANQSNEDDDEEYEDVDDDYGETMLTLLKVDVEVLVPLIDPDRVSAIMRRNYIPNGDDPCYAEGPAGTLFHYSRFRRKRMIIVTLVDYRHNRCIHVAVVKDYKLTETQEKDLELDTEYRLGYQLRQIQVEWDGEYRRLMLSYFDEECDNYRVW